jgi:hypothetical protein
MYPPSQTTVTIQNVTHQSIKWRPAIQAYINALYLSYLSISPTDTGPDIMTKMRSQYIHIISRPPFSFLDRISIFRTPVVETGIFSVVSSFQVP